MDIILWALLGGAALILGIAAGMFAFVSFFVAVYALFMDSNAYDGWFFEHPRVTRLLALAYLWLLASAVAGGVILIDRVRSG